MSQNGNRLPDDPEMVVLRLTRQWYELQRALQQTAQLLRQAEEAYLAQKAPEAPALKEGG
jgi:hypothetical protein